MGEPPPPLPLPPEASPLLPGVSALHVARGIDAEPGNSAAAPEHARVEDGGAEEGAGHGDTPRECPSHVLEQVVDLPDG